MKRTILIVAFLLVCGTAQADEIDDIIPAIIQVESGGNPNAISSAGAVGIMQITPIVLKEWNGCNPSRTYDKTDLFCGAINIRIGEWYLRRLKDHYLKENYTIERMLAAYNGGITRLRREGYDIESMPKETRDYVKKVLKKYKELCK